MKIEISNHLLVTGIPEPLAIEICKRLTMPNPQWAENERMGRFNGNTPRELRFYQTAPDGGLIIPRGFGRELIGIARQFCEPIEFIDRRISFPDTEYALTGTLRDYQQAGLDAILKHLQGVVQMPTGAGKTVVAIAAIAARRQPSLVVCHTKELANQWVDRGESFLGIPRNEIGIIGAGKRTIGKQITVALVQSLCKCADQVAGHIGLLIVDECHRCPSRTFTDVVSQFDCKYMLGLSATPYRRDGLSRVINFYMGDTLHRVDAGALIESGQVLRPEVIQRETSFRTMRDARAEYSKMLSELTEDVDRNRLIAKDVAQAAERWDGISLVLSDRKGHCEALRSILASEHGIDASVLTGDLPAKARADLVNRLNAGQVRTLIATTQLLSEGFDCAGLSTLFMGSPIKFSGRVLQCVGRVLRPAPGKERARVFDYMDVRVPVLAASAKARQRVYANL